MGPETAIETAAVVGLEIGLVVVLARVLERRDFHGETAAAGCALVAFAYIVVVA